MDVPATHERAMGPEVVRDQRGIMVGRIERQRLTGLVLDRDAQGVFVGRHSVRERLTRDASGWVIAWGDVLSALPFRP